MLQNLKHRKQFTDFIPSKMHNTQNSTPQQTTTPLPKRSNNNNRFYLLLLLIGFLTLLGLQLFVIYLKPNFHFLHESSPHAAGHLNDEDEGDSNHHIRSHNDNGEEQKHSDDDNSKRLLEQKLASCQESLEMASSTMQEQGDKNNHDAISSSDRLFYCKNEQLSGKCSSHGSCFDPLAQQNKKKKSISATFSTPTANIFNRRSQQLRPGSCVCDETHAGKDCSIASASTQAEDAMKSPKQPLFSLREVEELISVIVVRGPSVFQRRSDKDEDDEKQQQIEDHFVEKLKKHAPGLEVLISSSSSHEEKKRRQHEIDQVNALIDTATSEEHNSNRPFLLFLGPDVDLDNFDLWRVNLEMLIDQMLTTDVDVLGFMTIEHNQKKSHENIFDPFCYLLYYHSWRLRHRKAPFGYERHQDFTMFCDRISNSFLMRKSLLTREIKKKSKNNKDFVSRALNSSFLGAGSDNVWPLCNFGEHHHDQKCKLFDPVLADGNLVWLDFFLRIKRFNQALKRSWRYLHGEDAISGDRNTHHLLNSLQINIGACAECMIDIVGRDEFVESIHHHQVSSSSSSSSSPSFTERHQIEAYFDAYGRRSKIVCVKSGGIYGHSNKGLYSPLCHRLMRQRDFLWISNMWEYGLDDGEGEAHHIDSKHNSKKNSDQSHHQIKVHNNNKKYSISVHHGNLFGALRFQEELLWETDGDFDLICHTCSHTELMDRMNKLVRVAGGSKFETVITYPEKPWYVAFKKEKTDFQLNARSPLSKQTRGKPIPQKHNVSVSYQGRLVHMNGFASPWRSVREDPGHDYRDLYLAQQGWVLHFTKNSVACGIEGHNACLPDCRNPEHFLFDHEYCSDDEMGNVFDRNPILWFDEKDSVFSRKVIPEDGDFKVMEGVTIMNEEELHDVAYGETEKWMRNKLWQYL